MCFLRVALPATFGPACLVLVRLFADAGLGRDVAAAGVVPAPAPAAWGWAPIAAVIIVVDTVTVFGGVVAAAAAVA